MEVSKFNGMERMRIFVVSDLHTDFPENMQLIRAVSDYDFQEDVLIIAGDIANQPQIIEETLITLHRKFRRLFFVPGNHELWVDRQRYDSIEKFHFILELCEKLNVNTKPKIAAGVLIVPLFSWYSEHFDVFDLGRRDVLDQWSDFYLCKWPEKMQELDHYFCSLNEPHIRRCEIPVVTFSHFLPRSDLLPPPDWLRFKGLPKVAGSYLIEKQIRKIGSTVHVFGHSHINMNVELDGIRYVQNALSYPRERQSPRFPLKQIQPVFHDWLNVSQQTN